MRADQEGKAWFWVPEGGRYGVATEVAGRVYRAEVRPRPPGEWSQVKLVRLRTR